MEDLKPFIQKLSFNKIIDNKFDLVKSKYYNEPLFSLGYHYYLKQVRQKLNSDDLINRNFYLVLSNFEINVPEYEDDLEKLLKKKLKLENFYSRDFFKVWEILSYFDILSDGGMKTLCLSENGGFISGINYFREYYFSNKSDKLSYEFKGKKEEFKLKDTKFNKLDKNKPLESFETSNSLLTVTDINKFIKDNKLLNIDLITCNGSDKDEIYLYKYLLSNILLVLKVQSKNGNFILRLNDIYTNFTLKLINILHDCYKEVYICKPLFSRDYTNEKYLICKNLNMSDKDKNNLISKLEKILNDFNKSNLVITDLISDKVYEMEEIKSIVSINNDLSNNEHNNINKIIDYRNKKNYFGEEYNKFRNNQIKNTDWWFNTFIKKNYKELIKNFTK
jgi:hypothetical protein